jgi:hypothetical protein
LPQPWRVLCDTQRAMNDVRGDWAAEEASLPVEKLLEIWNDVGARLYAANPAIWASILALAETFLRSGAGDAG